MLKKILITGAGSYVGTSFANWLSQWPENYHVTTLNMRDDAWLQASFTGYDAVFHVAGIVHQPKAQEELYFQINRDMTVALASKAKSEGVSQFIFMSTMAVYGKEDSMKCPNEITAATACHPTTPYGKSKLEAEQKLQTLHCDTFSVCNVRPPMVFGENCVGNYRTLRSLALRFGVAPAIQNQRSMIYIGNLCEFIKRAIDNQSGGIFCPQDAEYYQTSNVMQQIAGYHGRKCRRFKFFGLCVKCAAPVVDKLQKAFWNLTYARELSGAGYCVVSNNDAIEMTEAGWRM